VLLISKNVGKNVTNVNRGKNWMYKGSSACARCMSVNNKSPQSLATKALPNVII